MGRKIYDEDLRLNLILNGEGLNQGSKKMVAELGKMEQEMVKMEQKAKQLATSIKTLSKDKVANAAQLKILQKEYGTLNQAMRAHQLQIDQMRKQVGLAGMTVEQLRNHLNALKVQLFNMPGSAGSPMFKQLQAEIAETEIRLRTLTTGASRMAQAWERLERAANKAGTVLGWIAVGVFAITRVITGVITRMKDLEDLVGSVRKNTNLTVGEVWDMKEAFDKWDTRTKTDDLMQMAIVGGKLGVVGREEIMDFVDSANKIQIALGDDLQGTVEDTVNNIGKLTNAFRVFDQIDQTTGQKFTLGSAMIRTGDVLNELAKSSAASAGTILNYMSRLAGVSELSKFSIAQVGGFASVLDALHIPAERGATALEKIMFQLGKPQKVQDFAEALHMTVDQYKEMLLNNPYEVLTSLIRKFISHKNGLLELTEGMSDFGVKGVYAKEVLGSLAQNLDVVDKQVEIATKQWKKGGSVLSEYNIMNNNFTAEIMKQQKIIKAQTDQLNQDAEPAVLAIVTAWAKFVVAMKDWIGRHWSTIKALTFAYIALKAPMIWRLSNLLIETIYIKANTAAEAVKVFWMKVSIIWTRNLTAAQLAAMAQSKLLTIANIAFTQGLGAAMVAMRALSTTMYLFPGVAMVATVAALAGAFYMLVVREKELTEVEKRHRDLQKSIQEDFFKEKANLTVLMDRLKDVNISQKERSEILKKLNTDYKDYLPSMIQENATADDLAKSYDLVVQAMARKIAHEKLYNAGVENRTAYDTNEEEIKRIEELIKRRKSQGVGSLGLVDLEDNLTNLRKTRKVLIEEYSKLQSDISKVAPKSVLDVKGNPIPQGEDDSTFKQRMAQRDSAFKIEEVQIKEQYAKKTGKQDEMNAKLKAANLRYLNETIKDYEDSRRIDGESEDAYWQLREKRAELSMEKSASSSKSVDKQKIKDAKEFEQQLVDIEKMRIETITNEREKEIALENQRHLEAMDKNWKNDQALDYEEVIHAQNITDINQKFLDKQLADKSLNFLQKELLLEEYWKRELITDEAYWTIKAQLEKDKEISLAEFKKQSGISTMEESIKLEIEELKKGIFWILLTEEEKEKAIDQIRLKYGRARAKTLKKTLEDELNSIKEQFTEQEQISYEQGATLIPIFQKIGEEMGNAFVAMFDKSQNAFAQFGKAMLLLAIEQTKAYIQLQYAKLLATNVASMGPAGVAVTIAEVTLIEAAFAAAKGFANKINTAKKTTQKAEGSYPVIGASDGRSYDAVYGGSARTGIYGRPTLLNMSDGMSLVGERAPELVVDGATFRRIQLNAPGLLRDIYAYAGRGESGGFSTSRRGVTQMNEGNYPTGGNFGGVSTDRMLYLLEKLDRTLNRPIRATVSKYGVNSLSEGLDDIAKFNKKVKR
jgi:TP901 family phage tail tape measure protein